MDKYHFRKFLSTGPVVNGHTGQRLEIEGLERALLLAYSISADNNVGVTVCKDSGTVDMPGFTEVATVKCLP